MSHVPHELAEELPDYRDRIHDLKASDRHFAQLFDNYHQVNREIHRVEIAGINVSDEHHEALKRERLRLKDELFQMLRTQA